MVCTLGDGHCLIRASPECRAGSSHPIGVAGPAVLVVAAFLRLNRMSVPSLTPEGGRFVRLCAHGGTARGNAAETDSGGTTGAYLPPGTGATQASGSRFPSHPATNLNPALPRAQVRFRQIEQSAPLGIGRRTLGAKVAQGLSSGERLACQIAERTLGASAEPWDTDGRQAAFDAILHLPDGTSAAFEVTSLSTQGVLQTESILARDGFEWPAAGSWTWTISVGAPSDIPRLRKVYRNIISLCEANGAVRPEELAINLGATEDCDADLYWLVFESQSDMVGHRHLPSIGGQVSRGTVVLPAGRGGGVDDELLGLNGALAEAFEHPYLKAHFDKLSASDHDERHLFIHVHSSALPFDVMYALMNGSTCPPEDPPVPASISHLWLAPQYSERVLLWSRTGWTEHFPYDSPTSGERS